MSVNEVMSNIADIVYLTTDNAEFYLNNDFVGLRFSDKVSGEKKEYARVNLHRAFPFEQPYNYISVLDMEMREIGIIGDVMTFPEDIANILVNELERKYYMRSICEIFSVKERYGFSYWKVMSDVGEIAITLKDTYKSIFRISANRVIIQDVDANRYEIKDIDKLDKKSYKKIELYL